MTIDPTERRAGIPYRRMALAGLIALLSVLALQPLFVLSLTAVRSHTHLEPMRAHVLQGYEQGLLDANEAPRRFIHARGHVFTECTALHLSLDDEPNALKAALLPQLQSAYVAPCRELKMTAEGVPTSARTDYARYWHGYRLYVWPMLEHFSVAAMRYTSGVLLFGALALFLYGLRRASGATAAAIFVIVLFSLTDIWSMWTITPHAISTAVILAGAGAFALHYARYRDKGWAIVLAAVAGAVFNFFDFLINPPMMPMLFAFIVIAVDAAAVSRLTRRTGLDIMIVAAVVALSWFAGYALTWMSKWALAVAFSESANAATWEIINQILLRTYGQDAGHTIPMIPLYPTLKMIGQSFISVGSITVALLAAALSVYLHDHWASFERYRFALLVSPCVIPLLWFEILSNHTQTHAHFTYRSESAVIAMFMAAAVMAGTPATTLRALLSRLWMSMRSARPRAGSVKPTGA